MESARLVGYLDMRGPLPCVVAVDIENPNAEEKPAGSQYRKITILEHKASNFAKARRDLHDFVCEHLQYQWVVPFLIRDANGEKYHERPMPNSVEFFLQNRKRF